MIKSSTINTIFRSTPQYFSAADIDDAFAPALYMNHAGHHSYATHISEPNIRRDNLTSTPVQILRQDDIFIRHTIGERMVVKAD